jgi:hypothetical protein
MKPKFANISDNTLLQLASIEAAYHDWVDIQLQHNDYEHTSFADYASQHHNFHNRQLAEAYWKDQI